MTLILVERLEAITGQLKTQPLWLVWVGCQMPPLNEIWQQYLRRFGIEHWYRLAKQTLHWTIPQLSTPLAVSTVERFDAIAHLAIMASERFA